MLISTGGPVILDGSSGGGSGGGVSSLNSLTGALSIVGGAGVSVTPAGSSVTLVNTQPWVPDILSETKPAYGTSHSVFGKAVPVVNNATQTLINLTGVSGGWISYFFLGWNAADIVSTMTIVADGNTVFSDRACLFFGAEYQENGASFMHRFLGASNDDSNNVGFYSYIPIPFTSSLSITFTNTFGSTHNLYWTIGYQTGVANSWPLTQKLVCRSGTVSAATPYSVNTLVNDSGLNPGRLLGITCSIDSVPGSANPTTGPLEGEWKMYFDGSGSPNWNSSGTEDYFGMSNYFQGFLISTQDATRNGITSGLSPYAGATLITAAGTWNAYRFHILDPITFQNALKVTWDAGESSFISWTGTVRFSYCLYYYTT